MTARNTAAARKTTAAAAKATPAKATAAAKAAAPAAEADLADLATKATEIKELPKVNNNRTGTRTNPFIPLVEKSLSTGKPLQVPPVADDKQAARVVDALWRAGSTLGVKVSSRRVRNEDGTITVAFEAKKK